MATPSHHNMKIGAAGAQTPQSAAAGAPVWRVSVSATGGQIQKRRTVDDTVNAATLTVHAITTGTVPQEKKKNHKGLLFISIKHNIFNAFLIKTCKKEKQIW